MGPMIVYLIKCKVNQLCYTCFLFSPSFFVSRRQKIHKHEDIDMKETPRQRGQDNPLYLTFDKMDTDA